MFHRGIRRNQSLDNAAQWSKVSHSKMSKIQPGKPDRKLVLKFLDPQAVCGCVQVWEVLLTPRLWMKNEEIIKITVITMNSDRALTMC